MLDGVFVANLTPLHPDASINIDAYLAHAAWLQEQGVAGLIPFGTNGEGPLFGVRERLDTLEALFARSPIIKIVPTVSHTALPEALQTVRAYNDLPASAILVLPPYYFKPVGEAGLRRYFERILDVSRHPVIVYHIPKYALPIPPSVVTQLAVWGAKDSDSDADYTREILAAGKGVLIGTEDDLWGRLTLGANGIISALGNFIPELIVAMERFARSRGQREGIELSARLQAVRAASKPFGIAGLKALAQRRHGIAMGSVRPPLTVLPERADFTSVDAAVSAAREAAALAQR